MKTSPQEMWGEVARLLAHEDHCCGVEAFDPDFGAAIFERQDDAGCGADEVRSD